MYYVLNENQLCTGRNRMYTGMHINIYTVIVYIYQSIKFIFDMQSYKVSITVKHSPTSFFNLCIKKSLNRIRIVINIQSVYDGG